MDIDSPIRILLIEDDPIAAQLIQMMLAQAGSQVFQVETATQLSAALDRLAQGNLDLLLSDLTLPDSNGLDTLARLRTMGSQLPIVVLTGLDDEALGLAAMQHGVQDYLIKGSVDKRQLNRTIRYALTRHHLEQSLRESDERFRLMADSAPALIWMSDARGQRVFFNRGWLTFTGRTLAQEIDDGWQQSIHSDDYVACCARFQQAIQHHAEFEIEYRLRRADAEFRWLVDHGAPRFQPDGELAGYVGSCVDITERKQAEVVLRQAHDELDMQVHAQMAELQQTNEALRTEIAERERAEAQVQIHQDEFSALSLIGRSMTSIFDLSAILSQAINVARLMLNARSASVLLCDRTCDTLIFAAASGPNADKLIGTTLPTSQGLAGWAACHAEPVLVTDTRRDERFHREIDRATGMTTESIVAVPLVYQERVIGVIEALNKIRDVFDQHDQELLTILASYAAIAIENARLYEAEREQRRLLQHSQAQLIQSEKLAALGRMAASLAHEINNPLQALDNCLQLSLMYTLSPDEQREYIQLAADQVERLRNLMTRTLDFARPHPHNRQALQVNQVVEQVLALSGKYFQHQHITLETSLQPDLPLVQANADELSQVFLNLTLNAVDAMPSGGRLTVTSQISAAQQIAVDVADTGVGITPDQLDQIFEPFFTTKENGTGMGLSVSYNIIKQHAGDIDVRSSPNEGTTFTVRLPILRAEHESEQ